MTDPKQHSEHRGMIESILRYIPGFHGYLEKDYRQESDYLARKAMADRLQRSKQALDDYMLSLINAGQLDAMTNCERAKNRLDGLINKMRGAVRGYSGFFDYVRVDMGLLDQVYEHDMALLREVEALAESIEKLAAKPDPNAIGEVVAMIGAVDDRFEQRGEMLNGLSG